MAYLAWPKANPFFDNNGDLLAGGVLRIYDAQTTSYKTVYKDSDETVPWTNGITLDSSGRLSDGVYVGAGSWKYTLETSAGVVLVTQDDIPGEVAINVSAFARPNMPVLSKSLSYTVLADDIGSMIQADATGGDVTITLISAIAAGNGAQIGVQNVGTANRVIVTVPGGEQINGVSSVQILQPRAGGIFTSNAGAWSGAITGAPTTTLAKTTTYTVDCSDIGRTIAANATGGAFTITLPPAASAGDGFEITVIKTDSSANAVTLDGNASETINGAATVAIGAQNRGLRLRCTGTAWLIARDSYMRTASVDNTIPRFDGTAGDLQTTGIVVADTSNDMSGVGQITQTATGANKIPTGTTAQRPTPSQGMLRENTDIDVLEHYDGAGWRILDRPLLHMQQQQSSGVEGGTFIQGAWQTRVLNQKPTDEIGSTLSSNQFTLPAGTYEMCATAPAYAVSQHKAKLRNITDSADTLIGTSEYAGGLTATSRSFISGRFTIAATKTFQIQHRCTNSQADNGLGVASNMGAIEVYTDVMVWRVL